MDSLIASIIFLLPGFLAYFWLQAFGMNPVTKHSTTEFTTVSIFLWLPVALLSLEVYNSLVQINVIHSNRIWTMDELKKASSDFDFIVVYFALNIIISFLFSAMWAIVFHRLVDKLINAIRHLRNMAPLSKTTSVWDEFFIRTDEDDSDNSSGMGNLSRVKKNKRVVKRKEKIMLLQIAKIDKPTEFEIGSMIKASRPYETEKAVVLADSDEWRERLEYYDFATKRVYLDLKSGLVIKELDYENPAPKKVDDD